MSESKNLLALLIVISAPLCAQGELPPEVFLRRYCTDCHSGPSPDGDLDLSPGLVPIHDGSSLRRLQLVRGKVRSHEMPPADEEQPDPAQRVAFLAWAKREAFAADERLEPSFGRVTVRRLSRAEYDRTVKDLLGVDLEVSAGFPADDLGYGFDNVGDALSFSLLHLEKYADAAERLAEAAIVTENPDDPAKRRFEAEALRSTLRESAGSDIVSLYSNGELYESVRLPRAGEYEIRVRAFGQQAGAANAMMRVSLGGVAAADIEVAETHSAPGTFTVRVRAPAGEQRLSVAFVNDYWNPEHKDPEQRDRNLLVDWVELVGPVDPRPLPSGHVWLLKDDVATRSTKARAAAVAQRLLPRVFRRPATSREVERVAKSIELGAKDGGFLEGVRLAVATSLVSPHFLFRMEPTGKGRASRLDGHPLAVRLSYFLWGSLPDDALFEAARSGALDTNEGLLGQARRLIADPKAVALSERFAAQWLEVRNLEQTTPDPERFPEFTSALRSAMRRETELFFAHVLSQQRPLRELIDADYTFVNDTLATFYDLPAVVGSEFRRVSVSTSRGGGILAHAGVLTVTSDPTRTSPVKRGKWVLQNLLDAPPPAPPPGADSFGEADVTTATSLRARMEQHRRDPQCAVCHLRMDALGLSLERFDPIGRFRAADAGGPIDDQGELPGRRRIQGLSGLRQLVAQDEGFARGLGKKLFVFAIGREPTPRDEIALERAIDALGADPTLSSLVVAIVGLEAFSRRDP